MAILTNYRIGATESIFFIRNISFPFEVEKMVTLLPFLLSIVIPAKSAGALAGVKDVIEAIDAGCATDDGFKHGHKWFCKCFTILDGYNGW
jgi:hypothetical protein